MQNANEIDASKTRFEIKPVHESDRLRFAKQILLCLMFLCTGVFVAYSLQPDNKALSNIFELIKSDGKLSQILQNV